MSNEDLHRKILGFLSGEFVRTKDHACIKVELEHAPRGYRGDELRTWHRVENPEIFDDLGQLEQFVTAVIERAETEADSHGAGQHRFVLRTHQHLGGRAKLSFSLAAGFSDTEADTGGGALAIAGGDAGVPGAPTTGPGMMIQMLGMQMRHNERYHTTQVATFQSTLGVLSRVNEDLREENAALRKERIDLLARLDDSESKKDARDLEAMKQLGKDKRKDLALGKIIPLLPLVASKILGKDTLPGAPTPLSILVSELGKSLTSGQIQRIAGALTPTQQILLGEALKAAAESLPPEEKPPAEPEQSADADASAATQTSDKKKA